MMVLRPSSLAAVTILVWSTRLRPWAAARSRTIWRMRTTSSDVRKGRVWLMSGRRYGCRRVGRHGGSRPAALALQQGHAFFDVQRGHHALEAQAELDQGDGDRRPHADHHGAGVQRAGHGRDVAD